MAKYLFQKIFKIHFQILGQDVISTSVVKTEPIDYQVEVAAVIDRLLTKVEQGADTLFERNSYRLGH